MSTPSITVGARAIFDVGAISGGYTLGAAQLLAGSGSVTGNFSLASGARLSPGQSPGTLNFGGSLDISGAATPANAQALTFELGTASDLVTIPSGTLNIGSGVLEFDDFSFSNSGGLAEGTYTFFDASILTGTLGTNTSGTIGSYPAEVVIDSANNNVNVVVTPEPASVALALFGGSALLLRRRRTAR